MIVGLVNSRREAIVRLQVKDHLMRDHDVDAVIDTGFTGQLILPQALVNQLQLPWLRRSRGTLAFGRTTWIDIYSATAVWNGQYVSLRVAAGGTDPLIGMELLEGHQLWIEVTRNGNVHIDALP